MTDLFLDVLIPNITCFKIKMVVTYFSAQGLEGGSSEDNDPPVVTSRRLLEARQSAEGDVMTSPLMGDGGGGGDGSSGHGR